MTLCLMTGQKGKQNIGFGPAAEQADLHDIRQYQAVIARRKIEHVVWDGAHEAREIRVLENGWGQYRGCKPAVRSGK